MSEDKLKESRQPSVCLRKQEKDQLAGPQPQQILLTVVWESVAGLSVFEIKKKTVHEESKFDIRKCCRIHMNSAGVLSFLTTEGKQLYHQDLSLASPPLYDPSFLIRKKRGGDVECPSVYCEYVLFLSVDKQSCFVL